MQKPLRKKTLTLAVTAALAGSGLLVSSNASAEVTANIGVTSNYVYRGLTESDDDAAVQGGLDYEHESGFYLGTWVSSLGGGGSYEFDTYLGFATSFGDIGMDVGYTYFSYPRDDDADFGELHLGLSYTDFYASVAYLSNAQDSDIEGTLAYEIGAQFDLVQDLSLGLAVGYVDYDPKDYIDYTWWTVSLNKATPMGDFSFAYIQNDLDDDDDPRFVVSYTMTF